MIGSRSKSHFELLSGIPLFLVSEARGKLGRKCTRTGSHISIETKADANTGPAQADTYEIVYSAQVIDQGKLNKRICKTYSRALLA